MAGVVSGSMESATLGFLQSNLTLNFRPGEQDRHHFSVILRWGLSMASNDEASSIALSVTDDVISASLGFLDDAIERFPGRGRVAHVNARLGPRMLRTDNAV